VAESGSHKRFLALLDEHGHFVLALLRRLCRDRHDAEDTFQETAVRVWRSLEKQPLLRNPRGWLLTIAYRAYVDQASRQPVEAGAHDSAESLACNLTPPDLHAEHREQTGQVRDAVALLPGPLRDVVLLHYTGCLSIHETAAAMGLAVGTVKSRLNTALGKLRELLT
jgi:RNA polymerase sigma-70 factor, ECF subfamily